MRNKGGGDVGLNNIIYNKERLALSFINHFQKQYRLAGLHFTSQNQEAKKANLLTNATYNIIVCVAKTNTSSPLISNPTPPPQSNPKTINGSTKKEASQAWSR